jgi:selenocysteine lyase/cysteine desulfurase
MSLSQYRNLFPITADTAYLNHAAISPLSTKVTEAIQEHLQARSAGPVDVFEDIMAKKARLKENIAALIGARSVEIALVSNTSEGFNWLVNGLNWEKGDRILLLEDEFPSNVYPFLNLKRRGVHVDFVPARNGETRISDFEQHMTKETRILSVSFVKFYNGIRQDLKKISDLCRSNNILFSVDGIQGVGAIPLDVKKAHIDFLSNGGHKWLMSPMGCGFMYVSPHLHDQLHPAFAGWLSVKDSWNFFNYNLDFLDDCSRYEIGTANATAIVGAAAATALLCQAGTQKIMAHLLELGDYLIEKLTCLGFSFRGSPDRNRRSGIYTFASEQAEELFNYLSKNRVIISLREGALRIAPHFYNTKADIDFLTDHCAHYLQIAGRGHEE